jgi:hypothetical protein
MAQAMKGTAVEAARLDDRFGTVPSEDRPRFQELRQAVQQ